MPTVSQYCHVDIKANRFYPNSHRQSMQANNTATGDAKSIKIRFQNVHEARQKAQRQA